MALKTRMTEPAGKTLRVAFPAVREIQSYDPAKIHFSYEYILLENLYSSLIEIDPKTGRVLPAVAERFEWVGDELHLKIRDDLKTISGRSITAADVVFSLKRVILLAANTHGNFRDLICPGVELRSIADDCPGIEQRGEAVVLSPGGPKTILLSMLAATDFAIIPESAVDPVTLQIKDYRETSGLYHVDRDQGGGKLKLKLNPHHFHATPDVAETIEVVAFNPKAGEKAIDLLRAGAVDHVLTTNGGNIEELIRFANSDADVQMHATMKIRNFVLVFTEQGKKKLSLKQRRSLGAKVRDAFKEIYESRPGFHASEEFFPALGEGGLSKDQQAEMDRITAGIEPTDLPAVQISLLKSGDMEFWSVPINKRVPNAKLSLGKFIPDLHDYAAGEEVPDAFIAATDTGFMEDIGLISYSLNAGYLGLPKSERAAWVKRYMDATSKEERIESLRALHFDALRDAAIVPLVISPFVALARKPWRMELSELYANNQLWLVKAQ